MSAREAVAKAIYETAFPGDRWADLPAVFLEDWGTLADAAMTALGSVEDDLRSRLACVVEATYWDRPYDERIAAIRGMCDLTTNGMTPAELPDARDQAHARVRAYVDAVPTLYDDDNPMHPDLTIDTATDWDAAQTRERPESPLVQYDLTYADLRVLVGLEPEVQS